MFDETERVSLDKPPAQAEASKRPGTSQDDRTFLATLDVGVELAQSYAAAVRLRDDVIDNEEVPANQKAAVLNAVVGLLASLAKTRTDLYNSERMRRVEQALVRTLKRMPRELQETFISEYGSELTDC